MNKLGVNETLIGKLKDELSLLDSKLIKLVLDCSAGDLSVVFEFQLTRSERKVLRIVCEDVIEFGFYYANQYIFYNVERLKFIDFNDYVYLCLDPDERVNHISNEDQDFIKMKKVSGFLI